MTCSVCHTRTDTRYCTLCDAWLCPSCAGAPIARAQAAVRTHPGRVLAVVALSVSLILIAKS